MVLSCLKMDTFYKRILLVILGIVSSVTLYTFSRPEASLPVHLSSRDVDTSLNGLDLSSLLSPVERGGSPSYSCSAKKPCSNGSCCGPSGFCGFGDTYCGKGCLSNCNATAQCGKDAEPKGKTCPLNVCCSQYGFCGTTENFCNHQCQSHCDLNPAPPAGALKNFSILHNKVIGYYESWSARKDCHKVAPTDLPLDSLTHLNFAFAYIDPKTYEITTMDGSTPAKLFADTTNVKVIKPDLEIYISVGGWTFSDNKTDTQPLYGEIAADPKKRKTFADNAIKFMQKYGFNGLDIDWEYPGASDRGGKTRDVKNYVLLLKTLRETFDASGGGYGLTFTAPSSYWYLRWFDLENLSKYADWINLMSYDLHGVWDADDPIGNIVQAHTNLTEIKQAADLFWRVNVPPSKVVMGFGFYGRSFTLKDPSCDKPGCPFKGASDPGPCSGTGGILAYYEIMSVLNGKSTSKRSTITPTHDKKNAVNYFTFDKDQWVSYDDETTFKQKVDWANDVGLGGAMIWASDLDTDKYTAHSSLTGKKVKVNRDLQKIDKALSNPVAVVQDLSASNGQKCFVHSGGCVHLDDNAAMAEACGSGFTPVGWDDAGCGKSSCHCGKPVCCPKASAPKNCIWRGNDNGSGAGSSDCSAQCRPGEINIKGIGSSWGGGYLNDGDTDKCSRGYKVFCCPDPEFSGVTSQCSYAECGKECPDGKSSVFTKYDCGYDGQKYCCPIPLELEKCNWVGKAGDCANANCKETEVEIDRADYGGSVSDGSCDWGRKKAACCTIKKQPPPPAKCTVDLCKELPGFCPKDDDDESANKWSKRDATSLSDEDAGKQVSVIERRDSRRPYATTITYIVHGVRYSGSIVLKSMSYISNMAQLLDSSATFGVLRKWFGLASGPCTGNSVEVTTFSPGTISDVLLQALGLQVEHIIDCQIVAPFLEGATGGYLPSDPAGVYSLAGHEVDGARILKELFTTNKALAARAPIGGPDGPRPDNINDRLMSAFGSKDFRVPFLATKAEINGAKGRMMTGTAVTALDKVKELAIEAVKQDTDAEVDKLLSSIRIVFAVFEYLLEPDAVRAWNRVSDVFREQLGYVEQDANLPGLVTYWDVWWPDFLQVRLRAAKTWTDQAIVHAFDPYLAAAEAGHQPVTFAKVKAALAHFQNHIGDLGFPRSYQMHVPGVGPGYGGSYGQGQLGNGGF